MAARRIKTAKKQMRKTTKSTQGVKKRTSSRKTKAKTRAKEVTNPFRFLDLPAEIRNSIYELALHSKKTIIVDRKLELPPLLASSPKSRTRRPASGTTTTSSVLLSKTAMPAP
jgi:hypothetical protein